MPRTMLYRPPRSPIGRRSVLARISAGMILMGAAALPALAADPPAIFSGDGVPPFGTLSTKTIFAYGSLDASNNFTLNPGTIPGFIVGNDSTPTYDLGLQAFSTGGTPTSNVYNVDKVNSYDPPYQYANPLPGSNWVSAYLDPGGPSPGGDHSYNNEPGRVGNLMPDVFAYITTFTVAPGTGVFDMNGRLLSDDSIVGAYIDYDFTKNGSGNITGGTTAGSTALTITQDAANTFTYSTPGSFSGSSLNLSPGQHTLTFFVMNNNNDRTAIDFATLSPVPEPGAVAAGATMVTSLLGMMGVARLRRGRRLAG